MAIVGPIAVYLASVLLVGAGYMTYREKGAGRRAEWIIVALWPATLLVAFFVSLGWLLALVMKHEEDH